MAEIGNLSMAPTHVNPSRLARPFRGLAQLLDYERTPTKAYALCKQTFRELTSVNPFQLKPSEAMAAVRRAEQASLLYRRLERQKKVQDELARLARERFEGAAKRNRAAAALLHTESFFKTVDRKDEEEAEITRLAQRAAGTIQEHMGEVSIYFRRLWEHMQLDEAPDHRLKLAKTKLQRDVWFMEKETLEIDEHIAVLKRATKKLILRAAYPTDLSADSAHFSLFAATVVNKLASDSKWFDSPSFDAVFEAVVRLEAERRRRVMPDRDASVAENRTWDEIVTAATNWVAQGAAAAQLDDATASSFQDRTPSPGFSIRALAQTLSAARGAPFKSGNQIGKLGKAALLSARSSMSAWEVRLIDVLDAVLSGEFRAEQLLAEQHRREAVATVLENDLHYIALERVVEVWTCPRAPPALVAAAKDVVLANYEHLGLTPVNGDDDGEVVDVVKPKPKPRTLGSRSKSADVLVLTTGDVSKLPLWRLVELKGVLTGVASQKRKQDVIMTELARAANAEYQNTMARLKDAARGRNPQRPLPVEELREISDSLLVGPETRKLAVEALHRVAEMKLVHRVWDPCLVSMLAPWRSGAMEPGKKVMSSLLHFGVSDVKMNLVAFKDAGHEWYYACEPLRATESELGEFHTRYNHCTFEDRPLEAKHGKPLVRGTLSKPARVNVSEGARKTLKIPSAAGWYAWAFPAVEDVDTFDVTNWTPTAFDSFLIYGGFVYFSTAESIERARKTKEAAAGPAQEGLRAELDPGDIKGVVRMTSLTYGTALNFAKPQPLTPAAVQEFLPKFQPVTLRGLKNMEASRFVWLSQEEADGEGERPYAPYGGFGYVYGGDTDPRNNLFALLGPPEGKREAFSMLPGGRPRLDLSPAAMGSSHFQVNARVPAGSVSGAQP